MRKLLFLIFTASIFISCDHNDLSDTKVDEIPKDSVYISFKIDGEAIVIQSPSTTLGSQSYGLTRLRKLPNNSADSVIYHREYKYWSENHIITIGFCKALLLDTTLIEDSTSLDNCSRLNLRTELFKTGHGTLQFYSPPAPILSVTTYYTGLYISIFDKRTSIAYNSYVEKSSSYDNLNLYDIFIANSSFKIISSKQLYTGTTGPYSDFENTWFLESNFECALFTYDISNQQISHYAKKLTEGVIRGFF